MRKIIKAGIVYEFHTYIHVWNTVQKDQRNPMSKVSKIHCTDFNALNGLYVGDVEDGICGFYATLYAEYRFMSKMSKILCIQWPRQEGRLIVAVRPVGLAVHHHAVRGGRFVNFLGLVTLQGWLQARSTANPQFLKLKGAQQPGNSYISMGTKLHPPHSNRTCHKQII